jgi:hypothetical protein
VSRPQAALVQVAGASHRDDVHLGAAGEEGAKIRGIAREQDASRGVMSGLCAGSARSLRLFSGAWWRHADVCKRASANEPLG